MRFRKIDIIPVLIIIASFTFALFVFPSTAAPVGMVDDTVQVSSNMMFSSVTQVSTTHSAATTYQSRSFENTLASGNINYIRSTTVEASPNPGEQTNVMTERLIDFAGAGIITEEAAGISVAGNYPPTGSALADHCCGENETSLMCSDAFARSMFMSSAMQLESANLITNGAVLPDFGYPLSVSAGTNATGIGYGMIEVGSRETTATMDSIYHRTTSVQGITDPFMVSSNFNWAINCRANQQLAPPPSSNMCPF